MYHNLDTLTNESFSLSYVLHRECTRFVLWVNLRPFSSICQKNIFYINSIFHSFIVLPFTFRSLVHLSSPLYTVLGRNLFSFFFSPHIEPVFPS